MIEPKVEATPIAPPSPNRAEQNSRLGQLSEAAIASNSRQGALRSRHKLLINLGRVLIVIAFLAAWQWLPQVKFLSHTFVFLDSFFISSPSLIAQELFYLFTGSHNLPSIWPYFGLTVVASLTGGMAGLLAGAIIGLFMSAYPVVSALFRPFVTALNAVPKVAIIPLVVIVFGASGIGDALTAFMVVFFMFFYNALTGGSSIPKEVIQNMQVLGASPQNILWTIRLRYVAAWIFAQLPNGISLSLVGAVTSELLGGSTGLGYLLVTAVNTSDATLTFAVVVVLMITGVVLVVGTDVVEQRFFPWIEAVRQG